MSRIGLPTFGVLKHRSIVIIEPSWLASKRGRKLISRLLAHGVTLATLKA
jgi:hypothetical protein